MDPKDKIRNYYQEKVKEAFNEQKKHQKLREAQIIIIEDCETGNVEKVL